MHHIAQSGTTHEIFKSLKFKLAKELKDHRETKKQMETLQSEYKRCEDAVIGINEVQGNTAVKFNIWHKIDYIFVCFHVDDDGDKII